MSVLTDRLTKSAGLGGVPSAGAQSTSTFGMGTLMAAASSTGSGAFGRVEAAGSDVRQGKFSLAVLQVIIAFMVLWYVWTRAIQGGG